MIINENMEKNLRKIGGDIQTVLEKRSLIDKQIENFLVSYEKTRFNIYNEIRLHNQNAEFEYDKIKTMNDEYKAELEDEILKIYIPDVLLSYKNVKTHANKIMLLNVAEVTKPFANQFNEQVCIFIRVFYNTNKWDIDNRNVKPVSDGLIMSGVLKDDNISKMFYIVLGEKIENEKPHTEVSVFPAKKLLEYLKKYSL